MVEIKGKWYLSKGKMKIYRHKSEQNQNHNIIGSMICHYYSTERPIS